ncbi:hypothetical protein SEPCBS57363_000572 [Sporothrix epigloea]|uniref:Tr-type G domain-containing protein n=1 Tax=Sporothrix epigloea TaxID=1892477 RepID=A0ABP0D5H6_9PEZI
MDDLYDEFGNFIGEEPDASEEGSEQGGADTDNYVYGDDDEGDEDSGQELMEVDDEGPSNAVILHEDKQYYPTAAQVYGEEVEALVQEEDAQPLSEPIVAPVEQKKFAVEEAGLPPVFFDRGFMTDLMKFPEQIRNVAFAGHLHHGKTAFVDMLVLETHDISERLAQRTGRQRDEQLRYTDVSVLERERGVSMRSAPMSLVLPSTKGKSHLVNILDTPGHVDFADEVASSLRLVDGVCLVVDVVEGMQQHTDMIVRHAALEGLPLTLIINKVDRLILELKLPPNDAYYKLKSTIEAVNKVIFDTLPGEIDDARRLSPEKGNVLFACSEMRWCFTLPSFAKMYADTFGAAMDTDEFGRRLWGDIFFNPKKRSFTRKPVEDKAKRSFVHFVLEPIYKLFTHTISENPQDLKAFLAPLGITLKPSQYKADAKVLLHLVCAQFFGPPTAFVDMVVRHVPSPVEAAARHLERYYTGPLDTKVAVAIRSCDQDGPLVLEVTKLFSAPDSKSFYALGRVFSGVARPGAEVRVLGGGYSLDDEEDMAAAQISNVWIPETRYNVPVDGVPAGCWVLLGGVDNSIVKSATVVARNFDDDEDAYIFKPVAHYTESVFKIAVEPVNPSELPKMLDGIRKINKSFPLITTKVEESGEHILIGTGEMYMDCVMHDLRLQYADMEIKVSDPLTRFCETVMDESATRCWTLTPNKKNRLTMVAEPLEDGLARDIETGAVNMKDPVRKTAKFFQDKYDWDLLASRSVWAFGPEEMGANLLQDDTLPGEVDKKLLNTVKESIRQGFSWATREGPLCEEPIRNIKFKLMDVTLAEETIYRGGGQIIPTARRACYGSFMLSSPRLMEPVYTVSMTGPESASAKLYQLLSQRRGHVLTDVGISGTNLSRTIGLLPVIDSFGFETDFRISSGNAGLVSLVFDRWQVVPGDPLDRDVILRPMQMAPVQGTARDFVLKTRRRKGLSEDVSIGKFLEPELYSELVSSGTLEEGS